MEKIRELLGRLSELSTEELTELRGLIVAESDRLDGEPTNAENVKLLNELADAGEAVMGEESGREQAEKEQAEAADAAKKRLAKLNGESEGEDGDEDESAEEPAAATPEGEADADAEATAEGEDDEEDAEGAEDREPEAVTAAGKKGSGVAKMARRQAAPKPSPEVTAGDNPERPVITAAGLLGLEGQEVDRMTLAEGMATQLSRMSADAPPRGQVLVASARFHYPEDRRLVKDAERNAEIMEAAAGLDAVVASGGTCLPGNVDYEVPVWASPARPLRDGLTKFEATRGALRYVQPPDFSALEGATTIWTEATDASPGAATKPVIAVTCGTEELVYVDAVPTRLAFGNMMGRFSPEQVAANTDLAIVAAARIAENNLLNKLQSFALKSMTSGKVLGATRDIIATINQASAAFRWTHRIDRSVNLTAVLPDFLKDIIRVDLARELAHDTAGRDPLSVTDAEIEAILKAQGINPIWHLDGQPLKGGGEGYPLQGFPAQAGNGALSAFPTKVVWYLFPEGGVQFLDGGRLDLGVVRDATLDATNDYETFVETFETLANRTFAKGVLQLVTELCANGQSGATATVAGCA